MSRRQKITVTGADGQLGQELKNISALFPQFDFNFLSRKELSIEEGAALRNYFQQEKPEYLINSAAYTAVDNAEQETERAFSVNGTAVERLSQLCREFECRLVHISTDYVFDGESGTAYKEDDPVNPQSVYGASKLAGEQLSLENNQEVLIIRSSWIYSGFGNNFVKTMLRLMAEKKEISVVNDQFGSPTYAADLAETILEIIANRDWLPGIYHYCNSGVVSWFDFADAIRKIISSDVRLKSISSKEYPAAAKRPAYSVLNTEKIRRSFGIHLKPWKESLKVCLASLDIASGIN